MGPTRAEAIRKRLAETDAEAKFEPFMAHYREHGTLPLDDPDVIWISVTFHGDEFANMEADGVVIVHSGGGESPIRVQCLEYRSSAGELEGRRYCKIGDVEWESNPGDSEWHRVVRV
jgi:hypothetical protein